MNLKNIARDGYWMGTIKETAIGWATNTGGLANSDGTVKDEIGSVFSTGVSPATGNSSIGMFFAAPLVDVVPFRVKAYVPTNDNIYLMIGRAPATITGTDDTISHINRFHLVGEMDEILMIEPLAVGDGDRETPIFIGIQTEAVSVQNIRLSVQRLDVAPPQFSIAVP